MDRYPGRTGILWRGLCDGSVHDGSISNSRAEEFTDIPCRKDHAFWKNIFLSPYVIIWQQPFYYHRFCRGDGAKMVWGPSILDLFLRNSADLLWYLNHFQGL